MKVLVWLLSLVLALPAGGLRLAFTAEDCAALSDEALAGLNAVLADTRLLLNADSCQLLYRDAPLLWAEPGAVGSAELWTAADTPAMIGAVGDVSAALGRMLLPWETERTDTYDLQEAGTARRCLQYVLGEEGWSRMAPQIAELLQLDFLADSTVTGKATFRRYFDRQGQEIGAYFYAARLQCGGVTREVRLEYGFAPEKGLYLVFRCPDADSAANTRVSVHAKRTAGGWSGTAESREAMEHGSAVWTLQGSLPGTATLTVTARQDDVTRKHTVTLKAAGDEGLLTCAAGKEMLLTGRLAWHSGELLDITRTQSADLNAVTAAFAADLLQILREAAPESWQQLLFAAAPEAWVNAQKEETMP